MKKYAIFLIISLLATACQEKKSPTGEGLDPETEKKIDALIQKMTIEEKVGQLVQYTGFGELTGPAASEGGNAAKIERIKNGLVGSMLNVTSAKQTREFQELAVNSRLGIPLIFGYDVIHGFKTSFPVPLGETASWDEAAMEASAKVAAKEAAAYGIHWTFAPMMDLMRDARWGRVMEGTGEDPYLAAKAAVARIRGFQGDDLGDSRTIAACAKHFAGYGLAEGGRDYNTVDMSEHTLRNFVLPPFKAAADAGVATFMNSFNEVGGVPATASSYLQREILKKEWGFNGFVVSDWGSIVEMIDHGVAKDKKQAAELALNAGSDMDMEGYCYQDHLVELVKEGKVKETSIDDAVRRILRIKFRLGLFDDPYKYCNPDREEKEVLTTENLAIARDVARKSIVLLKNEGNLLPLAKDVRSIAVVGPFAADKDVPLGNWRGQAVPNSAVSLLEGVQKAVGTNTKVTYAEGCKVSLGARTFINELDLERHDRSMIPQAVATARSADVVILTLGEDCYQTGEGRSQVSISLTPAQQALAEAVFAANKRLVVVLMNGRPLEVKWLGENVPAIVEAWHLGSESGNAIADVLFGDFNPSGKLPMSFPRHVGQLPLYYNRKSTGRPGPKDLVFWSHYTDELNDPLFPFGYGLSYSTFEYSNIKLDKNKIKMNETLTVSVDIKNSSTRSGDEVVQLYLRDMVASVTRPVKELKGFQKITLKAGETKTVSFKLTKDDLGFYGQDGKFTTETGDFKVFVGTNSVATKEADFVLEN